MNFQWHVCTKCFVGPKQMSFIDAKREKKRNAVPEKLLCHRLKAPLPPFSCRTTDDQTSLRSSLICGLSNMPYLILAPLSLGNFS